MNRYRKGVITKKVQAWEAQDKEIQANLARYYDGQGSSVLLDISPNSCGDIARRAAVEMGISLEELKEWAHSVMSRYING